ncbi:hypothetical protein SCAR479_00379 [Seiridium cardinale]|uniref:Uncharacterized protein n=1 Tax=Seiridium cardinale TaxID=138064 RepID=A0ABR2Y9I9_9PEZI
MAATTSFEWILSDIDTKGYKVSKNDRATIRRQAMVKAGAARRERGDKSRVNRGQYPLFLDSFETESHGSLALQQPRLPLNDQGMRTDISTPGESIPGAVLTRMPLSVWKRATSIDGFNLLQLWANVETPVGQAISSLIRSGQNPTLSLLHQPKRFLFYIPDRYGQCACLDLAVKALMAKVLELLDPLSSKNTTMALLSHGRALSTMQLAVMSAEYHMQPDVLCAIEILGVVEVLSDSGKAAWAHHVAGASLLIQLKGPQGFKSDYEKDLFLSFINAIICECLRKNESCFLEEKPWQDFLDSLAILKDDVISERYNKTLLSRKLMGRLPGYFRQVTFIVGHEEASWGFTAQSLTAKLDRYYEEMHQFHEKLTNLYAKPGAELESTTESEFVYDLLAMSLTGLAMTGRLMGAVGDHRGELLESEALEHATEVIALEERMLAAQGWASYQLGLRVKLGRAILNTTSTWKTVPGQVIEPWRFDEWCMAMQRQTCNQ